MKITKFLVLAILALLLPSCQDDLESITKQSTLQEWQNYMGKHFTSETSDQFYWTQHFLESYNNDYLRFIQSCTENDYYEYQIEYKPKHLMWIGKGDTDNFEYHV